VLPWAAVGEGAGCIVMQPKLAAPSGAGPLPGKMPVALGLPRLVAQYHSRFSWARICYLDNINLGAGLDGWLSGGSEDSLSRVSSGA